MVPWALVMSTSICVASSSMARTSFGMLCIGVPSAVMAIARPYGCPRLSTFRTYRWSAVVEPPRRRLISHAAIATFWLSFLFARNAWTTCGTRSACRSLAVSTLVRD